MELEQFVARRCFTVSVHTLLAVCAGYKFFCDPPTQHGSLPPRTMISPVEQAKHDFYDAIPMLIHLTMCTAAVESVVVQSFGTSTVGAPPQLLVPYNAMTR